MITRKQAILAFVRDELHHKTLKNADGTAVRCRVNGVCKTWVYRPKDFRLPVEYGLRECFYITQDNAHEWSTQ